jgi:hypothetical protein
MWLKCKLNGKKKDYIEKKNDEKVETKTKSLNTNSKVHSEFQKNCSEFEWNSPPELITTLTRNRKKKDAISSCGRRNSPRICRCCPIRNFTSDPRIEYCPLLIHQ